MPNIKIAMPKDAKELIGIFNFAFLNKCPFVIRYPRANVHAILDNLDYNYVVDETWEYIKEGSDSCIITYGSDVARINKIINENNLNCGLVNARFIRPIDYTMLNDVLKKYKKVVIVEQTTINGSLYKDIIVYAYNNKFNTKIESISFSENEIITHGKIEDVLNNYGMSKEDIIKKIRVD